MMENRKLNKELLARIYKIEKSIAHYRKGKNRAISKEELIESLQWVDTMLADLSVPDLCLLYMIHNCGKDFYYKLYQVVKKYYGDYQVFARARDDFEYFKDTLENEFNPNESN